MDVQHVPQNQKPLLTTREQLMIELCCAQGHVKAHTAEQSESSEVVAVIEEEQGGCI